MLINQVLISQLFVHFNNKFAHGQAQNTTVPLKLTATNAIKLKGFMAILVEYSGKYGDVNMAISCLADYIKVHRNTVRKYIKTLVGLEVITKDKHSLRLIGLTGQDCPVAALDHDTTPDNSPDNSNIDATDNNHLRDRALEEAQARIAVLEQQISSNTEQIKKLEQQIRSQQINNNSQIRNNNQNRTHKLPTRSNEYYGGARNRVKVMPEHDNNRLYDFKGNQDKIDQQWPSPEIELDERRDRDAR